MKHKKIVGILTAVGLVTILALGLTACGEKVPENADENGVTRVEVLPDENGDASVDVIVNGNVVEIKDTGDATESVAGNLDTVIPDTTEDADAEAEKTSNGSGDVSVKNEIAEDIKDAAENVIDTVEDDVDAAIEKVTDVINDAVDSASDYVNNAFPLIKSDDTAN